MFEDMAGSVLAPKLAALDPTGLPEDDLVDMITAWERLGSWVAAGQMTAIAELARRRPRGPATAGPEGHGDAGHPGHPTVSEFAVDEVSAALRLSRTAAGNRIHVAIELAERLPGTSAALRHGRIDLPKARSVVEATTRLGDDVALAVERRVLPRAADQTAGMLRASLSRAVLAADPSGAEVRHASAVADRHVVVRPLDDGMAELWALLPADAAAVAYSTIDAVARRGPAGDRSMDARRADALLALVTGTSERARIPAQINVTVPAATLLRRSDKPGDLAGHGPIPASMARRIADGATWRRVTTHPTTGAVAEVGRPGYTPAAALADLARLRDITHGGATHPAHPRTGGAADTGRAPTHPLRGLRRCRAHPTHGPGPHRRLRYRAVCDQQRRRPHPVHTARRPRRPHPRPRRHLQVPRLPPTCPPLRPRPHRPLAGRPHRGIQHRGGMPTPPSAQAPDGLAGRDAPDRPDDLDQPHWPPLSHTSPRRRRPAPRRRCRGRAAAGDD